MKKVFKKRILSALVAASIGVSTSVFADTGSLKIRITDSQGAPVANAKVLVSSPDSLGKKEAVTDSEGFVRLIGLDPSGKYTVEVDRAGYSDFSRDNVKVVSGKTFNLDYTLAKQGESVETISVTGSRSQAHIDTTSATVSMDITLDLTESLPTNRNYQSYLQLAPGTKPSASGNPSSKSGVNYSDIGGTMGSSSDNVYYLDGIDTTDNNSGTFGANINSEIIQEQQVFTGGLPAKYSGGSGLVTRIVTKSGGNEFTGSVNYYFQDDSLVADNKHLGNDNAFSSYDTAVTLGGPIIRDELWFFASYQQKSTTTDVTDADGNFLRTVDDESDLGFLKLTWAPTDRDEFEISYFNDPREISGSTSTSVLENRDRSQQQGGDKLKIEYKHSWDDLIMTVRAARHESELSAFAANKDTRNDVLYQSTEASVADLNKGGYGLDYTEFRNRDELAIEFEYYLDTDWGLHTIETGYSRITNTLESNEQYTGDGAQYTSISAGDSGATLTNLITQAWQGPTEFVEDDYARIRTAMNAASNSAQYYTLYDTDADGTLSDSELGAIVFGSNAGNPTGDVNMYRIDMTQMAAVEMETKGAAFYLQDTLTMDQWTLSAGIRAEKWEHFASTGAKVAEFDWEIAPRLSAIYDVFGDGESKVWAFGGRYYDPVRTNMTDFAGNLTGPIREEQIFVGGDWLTYRVRGGTQTQDAFFSPTTKTPYTDEFMLGYAQVIGDNRTIEFTYTDRSTRDILEDYDLGLYVEALEGTDFHLPYSYFGYTENPGSNYVVATLAGGKRDYEGYEVKFTKSRADNWQFYASYTYNDAYGNTNSDSNADYQGDVVWLDPRAPGQYGKQPGNVEHLFKAYGTYYFDNGIEIGAVYNWNSGFRYSRTFSAGGRHLPVRVDEAYEFGGETARWLAPDAVGGYQTGSYGTLDLRVKYSYTFDNDMKGEVFLDIFNVLDDQAAISEQDLANTADGSAADGEYKFGEANDWVTPRRFYIGARLSF